MRFALLLTDKFIALSGALCYFIACVNNFLTQA